MATLCSGHVRFVRLPRSGFADSSSIMTTEISSISMTWPPRRTQACRLQLEVYVGLASQLSARSISHLCISAALRPWCLVEEESLSPPGYATTRQKRGEARLVFRGALSCSRGTRRYGGNFHPQPAPRSITPPRPSMIWLSSRKSDRSCCVEISRTRAMHGVSACSALNRQARPR